MRKELFFLAVAAAIIFFVPGCGDKGEAKPEKKEPAKAESLKERLTLSPEAMKNAGIRTITVKAEALPETISVTANISHNQDRLFHVTPRIRGRVVEVYVSVGSAVKASTPLALLDSTELGEAKAEYIKAKTLVGLAKANYEREKRLFEQKIAAQKDMLTAEAEYRRAEAEVRLLSEKLRLYGLSDEEVSSLENSHGPSRYSLRSPASGVVVEKDVTQGEVLETGKKVFTVSDLSTVWVLLQIYERDLAKVRTGSPVKIRTEPYPEEVFTGKVAYIGDTLDPQTRTVSIRVEVPNPGRRLKPGMFATAEIETPAASGTALVIPSVAIQKIEGKPVAFVREGEGNFHKRDLELGREIRGRVEVKSGLKEGEQVVTEGSFTLKSELLKETLAED